MNDNERELQNAAMNTDIVNLSLCVQMHKVCNDSLFTYQTALSFSNFLNLNATAMPVEVQKSQKTRVCYMVYCVEIRISPRKIGKLWAEAFLKQCGISLKYYHSHYRDVCNKNTSKSNKVFKENMDSVLAKLNRSKNTR